MPSFSGGRNSVLTLEQTRVQRIFVGWCDHIEFIHICAGRKFFVLRFLLLLGEIVSLYVVSNVFIFVRFVYAYVILDECG